MIGLEITTPIKEITDLINEALAKDINKLYNSNNKGVLNTFKQSVKSWVYVQPEIQSLLVGGQNSLSAMFGLTDSQSNKAVEEILDAVGDSLVIKIDKLDKRLKGVIEFYFQPINFSNLLTLNSGHTKTLKGLDLHWMDWLLLQGDTVIVVGYNYVPSNKGISGNGTMEVGGSFRVPPQFSGTASNNFITRAFENKEKEIQSILESLMQ